VSLTVKDIKNNAEMKNTKPKFNVGILNLDFIDPNVIDYCGERLGGRQKFFFQWCNCQ
jgi:hypothetical protein